jgi:hypothetical protein
MRGVERRLKKRKLQLGQRINKCDRKWGRGEWLGVSGK